MLLLPAAFSRFFGLFCSPSCYPHGSPVLLPPLAACRQDRAGMVRAGWPSASHRHGEAPACTACVIIIPLMSLDKPASWHRHAPELSGRQCRSMAPSPWCLARRLCHLQDGNLSAAALGNPPWDALGWWGLHPILGSALPLAETSLHRGTTGSPSPSPTSPFAMVFNLRPSPAF